MTILQYGAHDFGGIRIIRIKTDDTYSEITAADYLQEAVTNFQANFESTDFIVMNYGTDSGSLATFLPTIDSAGVITMSPTSVTLPAVNGHFPVFDGTSGKIVDSGYKIFFGVSDIWNGGSTSHDFTVTGLTSTSFGVANQVAGANLRTTLCSPDTNVIHASFSADPGTGTKLMYIYFVPTTV